MRWEAWVLVAVFVANAVITVNRVGHPRPTVTAPLAAWGLFEFGGYVWLVLRLAGVL